MTKISELNERPTFTVTPVFVSRYSDHTWTIARLPFDFRSGGTPSVVEG
jgi:hypothetical protein